MRDTVLASLALHADSAAMRATLAEPAGWEAAVWIADVSRSGMGAVIRTVDGHAGTFRFGRHTVFRAQLARAFEVPTAAMFDD